jgi:hypothetical protein
LRTLAVIQASAMLSLLPSTATSRFPCSGFRVSESKSRSTLSSGLQWRADQHELQRECPLSRAALPASPARAISSRQNPGRGQQGKARRPRSICSVASSPSTHRYHEHRDGSGRARIGAQPRARRCGCQCDNRSLRVLRLRLAVAPAVLLRDSRHSQRRLQTPNEFRPSPGRVLVRRAERLASLSRS